MPLTPKRKKLGESRMMNLGSHCNFFIFNNLAETVDSIYSKT
jgi:hypothetical protein